MLRSINVFPSACGDKNSDRAFDQRDLFLLEIKIRRKRQLEDLLFKEILWQNHPHGTIPSKIEYSAKIF